MEWGGRDKEGSGGRKTWSDKEGWGGERARRARKGEVARGKWGGKGGG